jgi:glycosyltransferase involved in cell wall biosynthesis
MGSFMMDRGCVDSIEFAPVSVIIPCYRCADTIDRAVDSVVNQTLPPVEIILVEDCSNDGAATLTALNMLHQKYQGTKIIIFALDQNSGPGSARNVGWRAASQPYIAFLDADDAWHPEKLKTQLNWMKNNPEVGLSGHGYQVLDEGADYDKSLPSGYEITRPVRKLYSLLSNPFATRTVMLKRTLPFKFKEGKRYIEDYQLWLEIIFANIPAAFIAGPLAATFKNDYGSAGLSSHLWKMEKGELDTYWQIYKNRKIGFLLAILLCLYSLAKYLKRVVVVMLRFCIKKSR